MSFNIAIALKMKIGHVLILLYKLFKY